MATLTMSALFIITRGFRLATKHKPVHPGEILRTEFLEPLGISMYRLARDTGMPADRVGRLVKGTRAFTGDTALRLARYFGTTPAFWMNLQARFDLDTAEDLRGGTIRNQVTPYEAA
jgi:addiction module HigA family antidote